MGDEAVSLFKCFYEQGNPNGNHSHLYMYLCFLMKHLSKICVFVCLCVFSPKATPPCSSKREDLRLKLAFKGLCFEACFTNKIQS